MAEKELARAIIKQALRDSIGKKDTQIRRDGRNFLLGSSPAWRNSLEDICFIAELSPDKIRKRAQFWDKNGWPKPKFLKNLLKF